MCVRIHMVQRKIIDAERASLSRSCAGRSWVQASSKEGKVSHQHSRLLTNINIDLLVSPTILFSRLELIWANTLLKNAICNPN